LAHKGLKLKAKTKEMVFHCPAPYHFVDPPLLDKIEHVTSFKLLGVLLTHTLSMDMHVNRIVSAIDQPLFLLNMLQKKSLSGKECEIIFQALIISGLNYALPALHCWFFVLFECSTYECCFRNILNGVSHTEFFILKLSYLTLISNCLSASRTIKNIT
jgi:hypothetical protein